MTHETNNMVLEEKIAQLQGIQITELIEHDEISLKKCREKIPFGIGHICQFGSTNAYSGDKLAKLVYDLQQYVLTETDSKIPILFHEEVIDGVATKGATITPQMIGMACSFNTMLVKKNAAYAGEVLKKLGGSYALSPMMDIITDARWGRGEEGFGEDSYVVSEFADAFMEGLQSAGVGATAKHYAGYGVDNQEEDFFINETLLPFEVAVRKSCVQAIMPGYHKFRGIPSSCSQELLIQSLRNHLGFAGMIVSDYGAINNIHEEFHYTKNEKESAILAINATVDVDFPTGVNYKSLVEAVQKGEVEEKVIDQALERVLEFKRTFMPKKVTLESNIDLDPQYYRESALQSARESIVLLKNDGILPLENKPIKLLLTGPNADSYYSLMGDYTWTGLAEFFHGIPGERLNPKLYTLLDGLEGFSHKEYEVEYERGFDWIDQEDINTTNVGGDERGKTANRKPLEKTAEINFKRTLEKAQASDVIVVAVGENRYLCGEGTEREEITLPGNQEKYVEMLIETGKPVILCVFGGRPMAIAKLAEKCSAVLYAWYPGEEGGNALAEILFGMTNPSAKLAVTFPDRQEDVPVTLQTKQVKITYPYGYGLSYTTYTYSDFRVNTTANTSDEYMDVVYNVENTGNMDGSESTQFYFINEKTGNKKVLGFTKTTLKVGEKKQVIMRFYLDQFGQYVNGVFQVVQGKHTLIVGSSSVQQEFVEVIEIVGDTMQKEKKDKFLSKCMSS